MIWRAPHDRERIWLEYHYRLDCFDYGGEFDVRDLPGYVEYPSFNFDGPEPWTDRMMAYIEAEQQHHAAIIRAALDGGHEPVIWRYGPQEPAASA